MLNIRMSSIVPKQPQSPSTLDREAGSIGPENEGVEVLINTYMFTSNSDHFWKPNADERLGHAHNTYGAVRPQTEVGMSRKMMTLYDNNAPGMAPKLNRRASIPWTLVTYVYYPIEPLVTQRWMTSMNPRTIQKGKRNS